MTTRTRRRWTARVAGAIGIIALVTLAAPFGPPADAHDAPVLPPGDWTPEQEAFAEDLVHRTEAVLPQKFSDYHELEALGFYDFGVNTPNGYRHFINPAWMGDDHLLDPNFPESLVYKDHGGGHLVLEAAMFYLKPEHTMDNIPEQYAWLPGWHVHEELCVDANGRFAGINVPGAGCPPGSSQAWSPPMMHVWIVDTECGHRFAGLGVTGSMCDPEGEHGGGHGGGGGGEHGHEPGMPEVPGAPTMPEPGGTPAPAEPIVEPPEQTG